VPLTDIDQAKFEGTCVTEAKDVIIQNNYPPLEHLPALDEHLSRSRIEGSVLDRKVILDIYRLAVISRNLFQFLKSNSEKAPNLFQYSRELFVDKLFEHHITKIINENGEIKGDASPKLKEIRQEIRDRNEDLIKSVNKIIKSLTEKDIVREDYLTLRDGRIVIPVKSEHKRHIRGFIHSESASGQTVYIEPEETLELNNELVSLSFAERREIERLLKELTRKIGEVSETLKLSSSIISKMDTAFAKAKYSIEIIGSFPQINNRFPMEIRDGRHPILLKKFGRDKTVPLNAKVEEKKVILITGPNAGGKTVVLKSVGLLVLLVQSGFHVPVSPDSNFHFFENILVDIGDEQSIEDDLSTFSSHLTNINKIINNADKNTLVLLDEIGTGTDPAEGAALAAASLVKLKEKGSTVFASTHHGSLKMIAAELPGFENAAMEFDTVNLKPAYVFRQGIPGSSYAFEIARRIGFDENFLDLAKDYLDTDKHKIETFLVDIESKSHEVNDKLKKLEIENSRMSGLTKLYQQNINKLENEKKEILRKAKTDAEEYLKNVNRQVEKAIKEIRESNAGTEEIKRSKNIISELKETNKNIVPAASELLEEESLKIGDFAKIRNTDTSGEITEIFADKHSAILKAGNLKIKAALKDLVKIKKVKEKEQPIRHFDTGAGLSGMRLDIRGQTPDEAEYNVIRFLDNSYSSGLEKIEILHGKGTGALKKVVKDLLKNHIGVKNYYFAPVEFGGEGITIVEFKEG
jgi:DNA mismatch repair protein MutS2